MSRLETVMSCVVVSANEQCEYIVYPPPQKKTKTKTNKKTKTKTKTRTRTKKTKHYNRTKQTNKKQNNKNSKQLSKCLTRAETSVVIIVFDGVLCEVCGYTVTTSYRRNINQVLEKLCLGH
jgi:hypothetical protein